MKAISFTESGPSSVLRYGDLPVPEPAPGEVRVRVSSSGVNPSDWKSRARGVYSRPGELSIPHHDGAGVIDAVGDGVPAERIGERVWLYFAAWQRVGGTAAQWSTVPQAQAVRLDDAVADEIGASLGIPAITAHNLLGDPALLAGRDVLVNGFGAVGFAAIQLARWAGARVVCATSSADKRELATTLGANAVLDPSAADAATTLKQLLPDGAVRIVEPALGSNLDRDLAVLAPGGAIGIYATEGEPVTQLPVRALIDLNARLEHTMVFRLPSEVVARAVADIGDALAAGYLRGYPVHHYNLAQAAQAHDAMAAGIVGKVVLDIP